MRRDKKRLAVILSILICVSTVFAGVPFGAEDVRAGTLSTADGYEYQVEKDGSVTITGCTSNETQLDIPGKIDGHPVTAIGGLAFIHADPVLVTVPEGVTRIGNRAFENCHSLAGVTLPDSLTVIGHDAFSGCSLRQLTIPGNVTSIGNSAFWNCTSLSEINIPAGVTSIGERAFENCESLSEIDIPAGVTSIGDYAFSGCESLSKIDIPAGVTSIGERAFEYCMSLSEIDIPAGVTSIGECAFEYCMNLSKIDIPAGVTSIGDYAFSGCGSLSKIDIPASVTSIGDYAFSGCGSLSKIDIPAGVTSIGERAFEYCDGLSNVTLGEGLTSIGYGAFANCDSLTKIVIPENVTSIGAYAFIRCNELFDVTLPHNLTYMGTDAFEDTMWLILKRGKNPLVVENDCLIDGNFCSGNVIIPGSVETIAAGAFGKAAYVITDISIPNSVKHIGMDAFAGTAWLEKKKKEDPLVIVNGILIDGTTFLGSATVPAGVTAIAGGAFAGNGTLTGVTVPGTVTAIEEEAFRSCGNLANLTLSNGLLSIGNSAFEGCSRLEEVTLPEGLTSIGVKAFSGVYDEVGGVYAYMNLRNITIPDSVTDIGAPAFAGCYNLMFLCSPDSYAAQYAKEWSIAPYGNLPDINGDGMMSTQDEDLAMKKIVGLLDEEEWQTELMDINRDGKVDDVDTFLMAQLIYDRIYEAEEAPLSLSAEGNTVYVNVVDKGWNMIKETHITYDPSVGKPSYVTEPWNWDYVYDPSSYEYAVADNGTLVYNGNTSGDVGLIGVYEAPIDYTGTILMISFDESQLPVTVTMNGQSVTVGGSEVVPSESPTPADRFICQETDGGVTVEQYTGMETAVTVPSQIGGKEVRAVGAGAFAGTGVQKVNLPESVESIGSNAFGNCDSLTNVVIPRSVTEIAKDAFAGSENVVFRCYANSAAAAYTIENEIRLKLLDVKVTYGNVDKNDTVDASDALMMLRFVVKLNTPDAPGKQAADVDFNGKVDASDALMTLQKVVKLIDRFPVES